MKRIGLLVGVLGGVLLLAGCDEAKRRAMDTGREIVTHAEDSVQDKAHKAGNDVVNGKTDGDADSADVKKRDKLKSDDDSEK